MINRRGASDLIFSSDNLPDGLRSREVPPAVCLNVLKGLFDTSRLFDKKAKNWKRKFLIAFCSIVEIEDENKLSILEDFFQRDEIRWLPDFTRSTFFKSRKVFIPVYFETTGPVPIVLQPRRERTIQTVTDADMIRSQLEFRRSLNVRVSWDDDEFVRLLVGISRHGRRWARIASDTDLGFRGLRSNVDLRGAHNRFLSFSLQRQNGLSTQVTNWVPANFNRSAYVQRFFQQNNRTVELVNIDSNVDIEIELDPTSDFAGDEMNLSTPDIPQSPVVNFAAEDHHVTESNYDYDMFDYPSPSYDWTDINDVDSTYSPIISGHESAVENSANIEARRDESEAVEDFYWGNDGESSTLQTLYHAVDNSTDNFDARNQVSSQSQVVSELQLEDHATGIENLVYTNNFNNFYLGDDEATALVDNLNSYSPGNRLNDEINELDGIEENNFLNENYPQAIDQEFLENDSAVVDSFSNSVEFGGGEGDFVQHNSSRDEYGNDSISRQVQISDSLEPPSELLTPPPTQETQILTDDLKRKFLKKLVVKFGKDKYFFKSFFQSSTSKNNRCPLTVINEFFQFYEDSGIFIQIQTNKFVFNCFEFPILKAKFRDFENRIISSDDLVVNLMDQHNWIDRIGNDDFKMKILYYIYKYLKSKNSNSINLFRFNIRNMRNMYIFPRLGLNDFQTVKNIMNQCVSSGLLCQHSTNEYELSPNLFY